MYTALLSFSSTRKNNGNCTGLARAGYFSRLLATGSNQLCTWHVNLCFCSTRCFEVVTNDFVVHSKGGEESRASFQENPSNGAKSVDAG